MDNQRFLQVIDSTPLVSIDLLLENNKGEILLGKRINRPAQNYWFVPGGRIRKNETIASAVERISNNELGQQLTVARLQAAGNYDHIYDDNYLNSPGINTHYVVLAYRGSLSEKLSLSKDQQHAELAWWPIDKLLQADDVHQNTKNYFIQSQ